MSTLQFFRIILARWHIIVAATLAGLLAAISIVLVVPPRYVADSRIMLDVIKPDPVTGQVMATSFLRAYTKTQTQLVKDYKVANRVVTALGWANDKEMLKQYRNRKAGDDRDFSHWAAQKVIEGTRVRLIEGSNILEIAYNSNDPDQARVVADAIRTAYADYTLEARQEAARRNADWYDAQAAKAKTMLFQSEATVSNYEKQNGILMQENRVDLDSARLSALASQTMAPVAVETGTGSPSAASMQLVTLDAEISQASKTLGPNNPQLIEMHRRREVLAAQAAAERSGGSNGNVQAARITQSMFEAQKSKVMAQREKVEHLRLLQTEVDLRRDQYNKAVARAAQLRQEADVADPGITSLGAAVTPDSPVFPNKPLIFMGSIAFSGFVGLALALFLELVGRRVRSSEDLQSAVMAPVLAIISNPDAPKRGFRFGLGLGSGAGRLKTARA